MPEILEKHQVKTLQSEERQTIVHCMLPEGFAYRIWPSTFLIERESGRHCKIITAFNITFAPEWTHNDGRGFTLIFEGLSKNCEFFDLKEIIPEEGGFEVLGIVRNNSDVYHVSF